MFVDASAWTAILLNEPERADLRARLISADIVLTSAVATWETVRALSRATHPVGEAFDAVTRLQAGFGALIAPIGEMEQRLAVQAHARFGKGVHPARLEHGRLLRLCLRQVHGVPLLYKGGDFALTDIEAA